MAQVNPDGVLKGQVAVVTGASRGIGEAIAKRMAMEGASVVVSARTVEASDHFLPGTIKQCVADIEAAGGTAAAIRCNLADAEERRSLIDQTESTFGPVDILVNNAAVTWFLPVIDFSEKRYRTMMDVQVYAPFELAQMVLPGMVERGRAGSSTSPPTRRSIRRPTRRADTAVRCTACARQPWNVSRPASPRNSAARASG